MKKFEIRLADQQRRNRAHLDNLRRFLQSERFSLLPEDQRELMAMQHAVMENLDEILIRRMELLGLPVCR